MTNTRSSSHIHSNGRQWTAFTVALAFIMYSQLTLAPRVEAGPPPQGPGPAPIPKLQPKFTSAMSLQLRQPFLTRANLYVQSIQAIKQVQTMQIRLNNQADAIAAVTKLKSLDAYRTNIFSRMVAIAEGNAAFKSGIAAAARAEGPQALANRLTADHTAVLTIAGSSEASSEVIKTLEADAKMIRAVGEKLQKAGAVPVASLPEDGHGVAIAELGIGSWAESFLDPAYAVLVADDITVALIAAAVLLIGALAAADAANYIPPQAPAEDPRSPFKKCSDQAYSRRESCITKCKKDGWCELGCWGQYGLDTAACMLLPQF